MKIFLILFLPLFLFSDLLDTLEKNKNRQLIDITNFVNLQNNINNELEKQLLFNVEKYFYCPEKLEFDLTEITNGFKDYWNDESQEQKDTYNSCLCNHYIIEENTLKKYSDTCPNNEKKLEPTINSKKDLEEFCLDKVRFKPLNVQLFWGLNDKKEPCFDDNNGNCIYNQGNKKFYISNLINKQYFDGIINGNNETYLLDVLNKTIQNSNSIESIDSFGLINNYITKSITVSNKFIELENKIHLLKISLFSESILSEENKIHIISEFNKTFLLSKILNNDISWTNPCDNTIKTAKEGDLILFVSKDKNILIYKLINMFNSNTNKTELTWVSLDSLSSQYTNTRIKSGYCSGGSWNSEEYIEFNECTEDIHCGNGATCISTLHTDIPEVRCQKNPNLNVYYTNDWFLDGQNIAIDRLNKYKNNEPLYSNRNYYSCIQNQKNYFGNEEWRYWHRKTLLKKVQK